MSAMFPPRLQPVKLPFTLFFPPHDFGDKITLSSRLRDAASSLLDGESLILPIPQGGPPDVPRIQLQSRDGGFTLQLASSRLVWEWNHRLPQPVDWPAASKPYLDALGGILRVFIGEYARPTRFGFCPQFLLAVGGGVNERMARELFTPGRIEGSPHTIKVGVLDQFAAGERALNLWTNLATARQRDRPDLDDALVVQFDLNTAPEDARPLGADEITAILQQAGPVMARRVGALLGDKMDSSD